MGVLPAWYTQAHSRGAINPCLYSRSCLAHSIEVTSYRFRSLAAQARSYSWASLPHRHTASNTVCDLMWGCTYVTDTWAIACFTVKEPDSLSLHALVPVHSPLRSSFCPRQMNKYPIQIPFLSFNQGGNHFCRKKKKCGGLGIHLYTLFLYIRGLKHADTLLAARHACDGLRPIFFSQ